MPTLAESFDPLPRGVYFERFLVNGHRWVYSVDSKGELVSLRCPMKADVDVTADAMWDELDRVDPMPRGSHDPSAVSRPPSSPPHLRLT